MSNASPSRPMEGRVPPHNIQAEESLLGAMLLKQTAISDSVQAVNAGDFYKPAHAHIYEAISALYGAGEPVDPVTVAAELKRAGLLDAIGGPAVLLSIQSRTPAVSNAAHYAKIVEENSLLRRLVSTASEIAELGYAPMDDVSKTLDYAESMMYEVAQRRVSDTMVELRDLLDDSLDRLEKLYERGDSITGTPSGYTDLDTLTAGLQPNALIVVGARPAMGKTSFALGAAANAALRSNRPVLFFSLEMGHLELTQRLLGSEGRIDATRLRNGQLNETDWSKISRAMGRLGEAPLWIDDNPNLTIMEIRAKARRLRQRHDLRLVVIDYLQLMSSGKKVESRQLEVPVIALSQLNRGPEQRSDKRPMVSDLRESGSIEQDADMVILLHREDVYERESTRPGEADLIVAKHRNGPTRDLTVAFQGHYSRFVDMAHG